MNCGAIIFAKAGSYTVFSERENAGTHNVHIFFHFQTQFYFTVVEDEKYRKTVSIKEKGGNYFDRS